MLGDQRGKKTKKTQMVRVLATLPKSPDIVTKGYNVLLIGIWHFYCLFYLPETFRQTDLFIFSISYLRVLMTIYHPLIGILYLVLSISNILIPYLVFRISERNTRTQGSKLAASSWPLIILWCGHSRGELLHLQLFAT